MHRRGTRKRANGTSGCSIIVTKRAGGVELHKHLYARDALRPRLRPQGRRRPGPTRTFPSTRGATPEAAFTGPDSAELDAYVERMEAEIERHAPGFRKVIVGRNGRPETPIKNLLRE